MTPTEIENLVVRLTGDGSSFQRMMGQAAQQSAQVAQQVQAAAQKIQAISGNLKGFANAAIGALGAFGLATSLKGAFDAFVKFEQANIRLDAALRSSGKDVATTRAEYDALAKSLGETTLTTRGQVMGMVRSAETMGLTNEQTKQAIINATALSGALGGEAEDHFRMAAMMQQGNLHLAQRAFGLQHLHTQEEKEAAINQRLRSGMEQAMAIFDSAGGKIERLGKSFKGLTLELGGIVADAVLPFVKILQQLVDMFKALDPEVKRTIVWITALTLGAMALGPVLGLLGPFLAPFTAVLGFLLIQLPLLVLGFGLWVIKIALLMVAWVAWKTVVLAGVLALAALKAVVWLTSLAFTVLTMSASVLTVVLLAVAAPLAFIVGSGIVGIVLLLGTAFLGLGAVIGIAATGLWDCVTSLGQLADVGDNALGAVVPLFSEWWSVLQDVFKAMQKDMPKAWALLQAGFSLAILQVRALWPSLWGFIRDGFSGVADFITAKMKRVFSDVLLELAKVFTAIGTEAGQSSNLLVNQFGGMMLGMANAIRTSSTDLFRDARDQLADAERRLEALRSRRVGFEDTPEIVAARELVTRLREEIAALPESTRTVANQAGNVIGKHLAKGVHEGMKLDAALFGSLEALTNLQAFRASLHEEPGAGGVSRGGSPISSGTTLSATPASTAAAASDVEWRASVKGLLQAIAGNTLTIARSVGDAGASAGMG